MEVTFKRGIPGIDYLKRFSIESIENNDKFKVMKGLEEDISFVVISPFDFYDKYEINLDKETIRELKIENPSDVLLLNIVTLGNNLAASTANLKAPIVINIKNNLGKQFIMQSDTYGTKHPLIKERK